MRRHALQALVALAFLPYEGFFSVDAIVRTIGRMLITHRRLLEWNPSSAVERALEQRGHTDLLASYRSMAIAPAIAATTWVGLALTNPAMLPIAGPILLLWGASPGIAWWLSRPLVAATRKADGGPDTISYANWRARHGRISRSTSARTTTGCHRTTCRSIRR